MKRAAPKVKIIVEGVNDAAAVRHLLATAGINPHDEATRRVNVHKLGDRKDEGGIDLVFQAIKTEIKSAKNLCVAFVVDADADAAIRWQQVRDRIRSEGVDAPDAVPADGFVGYSGRYQSHVGAWIMPDNRQTGAIEAFLLSMTQHQPAVVGHARDATQQAKQCGATFKDKDADKARLHAYLAWQDEPGNLYGIAIARGALLGGVPETDAFVAWVRRLLATVGEAGTTPTP